MPATLSLQPGSVLKNRFILAAPIGRGGMGTVFKARDLRKEEAQDRNPYLALKVLNDDFKEHFGALQALQREARKAQKLAHPNIVTVYDFDRDDTNVFMVMELLQGVPLDRLIKLNETGLGVKQAIRVMRGICKAMEYAHEQGILHADFKPANAFLTVDGVAKVFDFGIARAVQGADCPDAGGRTLFDPGTFAALTPAYAGCEVMEGREPDPRDDIYAIACVAYELMTGSHPYNRLSAGEAEKAHLTPKPPAGLSGRRWRVLRCALSLRREGRPKSVTEFLEGISPFGGSPATYAAVGMSVVATLAVAAVPLYAQIDRVRERSMVAALASADARRVEPALEELRTLEPARSRPLLWQDDARVGVINYYTTRIEDLVGSGKGPADYQQAQGLIGELERLYPDSQAVRDLRERVAAQRSAALQELAAKAAVPVQASAPGQTLAPAQASAPGQTLPPAQAPSVPALKYHLETAPVRGIKVARPKQEFASAVNHAAALAAAQGNVEALLARPVCDVAWDSALQQGLRVLEGLASESPPVEAYIGAVMRRVVALYVRKAAERRGVRQFDDASNMLARAGRYQSQASPERVLEQALLDDARTQQSIGSSRGERAAYVGSLKRKLMMEAEADDVDSAEVTLRVLAENLPPADRFLTWDGPGAVARACERLVRRALGKGELENAVELISRARAAAPALQSLAIAQDRLSRYQAFDDYLKGDSRPDVHRVRTEIAALYSEDPGTAQLVMPILAQDVASRLHSTGDPELAVRLAALGKEVFGGQGADRQRPL